MTGHVTEEQQPRAAFLPRHDQTCQPGRLPPCASGPLTPATPFQLPPASGATFKRSPPKHRSSPLSPHSEHPMLCILLHWDPRGAGTESDLLPSPTRDQLLLGMQSGLHSATLLSRPSACHVTAAGSFLLWDRLVCAHLQGVCSSVLLRISFSEIHRRLILRFLQIFTQMSPSLASASCHPALSVLFSDVMTSVFILIVTKLQI